MSALDKTAESKSMAWDLLYESMVHKLLESERSMINEVADKNAFEYRPVTYSASYILEQMHEMKSHAIAIQQQRIDSDRTN